MGHNCIDSRAHLIALRDITSNSDGLTSLRNKVCGGFIGAAPIHVQDCYRRTLTDEPRPYCTSNAPCASGDYRYFAF